MPQKFDNMDRLYTTNISPADALWTLIQGQTQSVKDALYQRMKEANNQRLTLQQQQYVSKSLKRAFAELEEARTSNMELPDASDLIKLIDKQCGQNRFPPGVHENGQASLEKVCLF